MSFNVSASSGEVPVPFWGSILTEEECTRRKDQVTETFVQACVACQGGYKGEFG